METEGVEITLVDGSSWGWARRMEVWREPVNEGSRPHTVPRILVTLTKYRARKGLKALLVRRGKAHKTGAEEPTDDIVITRGDESWKLERVRIVEHRRDELVCTFHRYEKWPAEAGEETKE